MSPRERVVAAIAELQTIHFDYRVEFQRDWHGYLSEAIASLDACLGGRGQPTDIDAIDAPADDTKYIGGIP